MDENSFNQYVTPHSITFTRNGLSRHYPVHPILFSVLIGFLIVFTASYFFATTYLVFRDNLIITKDTRNAQMLKEYEYRISNLRTNLDQVKSRQLMDQQLIKSRITELIERQKKLGIRKIALRPILKKAHPFGLNIKSYSQKLREQSPAQRFSHNLSIFPHSEKKQFLPDNTVPSDSAAGNSTHKINNPLFAALTTSIRNIDASQKQTVSLLHNSANQKLEKITRLMQNIGVSIPHTFSENTNKKFSARIGGPFEPLSQSVGFSLRLEALDRTLDSLASVRRKIKILPLANPAPGKSVSSRFGPRIDPFKREYAMHSGLDFKAAQGSSVYSTAYGTVQFSGRKGGYGNMIEIDHGNGYSTRYAHLSKILVKKGQRVETGGKIGKVGSTGRSTGSHLHYEIRVHGKPVNPGKYLSIGRKVLELWQKRKKSEALSVKIGDFYARESA